MLDIELFNFINFCLFLPPGEDRRIVILGKTGSGKSSLANTILGVGNVFKVSHKSISETHTCDSESRRVHGRNITLIDTPGVFDTDPRSTEEVPELLRCILACSPGPHAFLLVLKMERYTTQEQAVVDVILKYFSEEALKYTTVVFTHGDELPEGLTLRQWIDQNDSLRALVRKCGGRCHVFDNRRWKSGNHPFRNNQHQLSALLRTIDSTVERNNGRHYTNDMLKKFHGDLQKEVKRIQRRFPQYTYQDVVQEAKNVVCSTLVTNMRGAVVGMVIGGWLGSGAMVKVMVTPSPDLFQYVAASGAALMMLPTGAMAGALVSDKYGSLKEAARDTRELLDEIVLIWNNIQSLRPR